MSKLSNKNLTPNAQQLRKNMTRHERRLWYDFLKELPFTVNRQKTIGPYIVDFYIASAKLIIELDGSQHYEKNAARRDRIRDDYLRNQGLQVLRYSNLDIDTRFCEVCDEIYTKIILWTEDCN